ncbi:MAG TPA: hypothetical protein VFB72_00520 [Verrucomicrobiae bacterium]|nr:hypothetical protein [Verrucomicrobiae bacterium]
MLLAYDTLDMNEEMNKDQEYYVTIWKRTLSELLGWSAPQVDAWLEEIFHQRLVVIGWSTPQVDAWLESNRGSWEKSHAVYVHEPPEYWVIDALILEALRQKIGALNVAKLKRDIVQEIELSNPRWFSEEYNWSAARSRIDRLFETYNQLQ